MNNDLVEFEFQSFIMLRNPSDLSPADYNFSTVGQDEIEFLGHFSSPLYYACGIFDNRANFPAFSGFTCFGFWIIQKTQN